jgi:hypothetical protein
MYFDNAALQLYHGRLYLWPQTPMLKARWIDKPQGTDGSEGMMCVGVDVWCPERVVCESKKQRGLER